MRLAPVRASSPALLIWLCFHTFQLETWGAWEWEDRLLRETLAWMPEGSTEAATCLHHLGMVAQRRGDYDAALDWYRKSLAILEQLGDRAGMARSFSQIGSLYTQTRRAADAVPLNLRSLALRQQMQSPEVHIDLHWLSRQRHIDAHSIRSIPDNGHNLSDYVKITPIGKKFVDFEKTSIKVEVYLLKLIDNEFVSLVVIYT